MILKHNKIKTAAGTFAALTLTATLLTSAALAKPPVKKKPAGGDKTAIAAGKKVYDANGCANCHAIHGVGGNSGTNLTNVGADPKHTPKWMETAVVNPKAIHPDSSMPAYDSLDAKDLKNLVAYLGSLKK